MSENTQVNPKYAERLKRYEDAIACRESDRICIAPSLGYLPITLYNETRIGDALKDWTKAFPSWRRYHEEYEPDLMHSPDSTLWPTDVLDVMGCNYVRWPGHDFDDMNMGFQVKAEDYMDAEEYDEFSDDPTAFMMSRVLPRQFSNLGGLAAINLNSPLYFGSIYSTIPFGLPHVQESLKALMTAGEKMLGVVGATGAFVGEMAQAGFPTAAEYYGTVPFDMFNDTLRGLINATMDTLECPDELLRALDVATKIQVKNIKANMASRPIKTVAFYVHNGTDEFMSPRTFEKFYWPGMKAVMQAVIDCGGVPRMFLEGNYAQKLEHFLEFDKGTIALNLIGTDMKVAKSILGGHVCMSGGVDGTLLQYGTPEQVEANVKSVLDIMAPGGGYILDCTVSLDVAKPENLDMLFKTAKEYGQY